MGGYIDEWLVDLQGEGEQAGQALEKLYQEMYRPVFLLAASITNDTAMAEDAAHEVFLTLRRQAARYTPGSSGRAWIFPSPATCPAICCGPPGRRSIKSGT